MKKSLLFLPLLGLASNVAAQELHGVVTDADNNPLVGASVYWAETTIGASTSATGAYTVHRVKNYDRLVASYLGYVNDTIRIADGEFLAREGVPQIERALVERNDLGHVDSQTALHDDDVLACHLPNLVFFANFHRSILS